MLVEGGTDGPTMSAPAKTAVENSPSSSWRGRLGGALIGAGCAAAVALLLVHQRTLDPQSLVGAMRALGWLPLAMGLFGCVGVVAFQTLRWWALTRPVARVRYRDAYATVLVGGLLNTVLPAHAGDVLRVQYLSDRAGVSRATLLGTEVVDFWADKVGWLPAFALFAMTGAPPAWMYRAVAIMLGAAIVLFTVLVVVRRGKSRPDAPTGFRAHFTRGITGIGAPRIAFAGLVLAMLPWAWETLVIAGAANVAGIRLLPLDAFVLLTAFNVAAVVPVPGNVGTFEAASSSVLVSLGVPLERAIAFSLLYHASQLLPYVVGGGVSLLVWRALPGTNVASTKDPSTERSLAPIATEPPPLEGGQS